MDCAASQGVKRQKVLCRTAPSVLTIVLCLSRRPRRNLILNTKGTARKIVSNDVRKAPIAIYHSYPQSHYICYSRFSFRSVTQRCYLFLLDWRDSDAGCPSLPNSSSDNSLQLLFRAWTWISMLRRRGPQGCGPAALITMCAVGLVAHGQRPQPFPC
jgi:hypothetical protein